MSRRDSGRRIVHQDVSLIVRTGEVFAIAGGNGCGKSTLLREIVGLLTPTAGRISLLGADSRDLKRPDDGSLYRRFGVMFQHGALFSSMTLAENVAVPYESIRRSVPGSSGISWH